MIRHLLAVALAAAVACGVLIAGLVILPPTSSLEHANAVVVLSGDHGERLSRALNLLEHKVASTLVLDGEPDTQLAIKLCEGGQPFEVICIHPHPDNTAAEARAAAGVAKERHWKSLVVVTTSDHVLRARMRFRRCFDGVLGVEGATLRAGASIRLHAMIHEWLGTVNATLFDRGC